MIILLGLIAGYREVQILCEQLKEGSLGTSWKYENFRKWFWQTDQNNKKVSNWDSFHVSNGLFALVLCIPLATCTKQYHDWAIFPNAGLIGDIARIIIYWVIYMYFRNLMMHVILPLKPDWRYLLPLIGTWFKKKAKK